MTIYRTQIGEHVVCVVSLMAELGEACLICSDHAKMIR